MPLLLLLLAVAVVCCLPEKEPKKRKAKNDKLETVTSVGGNIGSPDMGLEQHPAGSGSLGSEPKVTEPSTIAGIKPADQIYPSKGK